MMMYAKLGDVAPAKPIRRLNVSTKTKVWHLTLDQIESNTGRVLTEIIAPVANANTSTHWFDERHVLYSKLRPYLNKVVVPFKRGIATTELVPMMPDPKRLDRKYLAYYLKSKIFVNWVSNQVAGAKMPRVSMKVFWDHEIPLPSLVEQMRVVAILDKTDEIRRKRQHAIKLADEFRRITFLDMFKDSNNRIESIGELIKKKALLLHKDGNHGSLYPRADDFSDKGTPFILARSFSQNGVLQDSLVPKLSLKKASKLKIGWIEKGDVLLAHNATVGPVFLYSGQYEKALIGTSLTAFRTNAEKLTSEFLFGALTSNFFQNQLKSVMKQTTRNQVPITVQRNLKIVYPKLEKQMEFSKFIIEFNHLNLKNEKASEESEHIYNALTQNAFSGRI